MKKATFNILLFIALCLQSCATTFLVDSGDCPRSESLVKIDSHQKKAFLYEITEKGKIAVPSQVADDGLYFVLSGDTPEHTVRKFALKRSGACQTPMMTAYDDSDNIILRNGDRDILSYKYTVTEVPDGVSKLYERGGYLHPVCTPSGKVITCIQPQDHYHHYGIWNPWTHIDYNGKVYDLWNLKDSLGTVRADKVENVYEGAVLCGFDAALSHVAFAPEGETVVMKELLKVRARCVGGMNIWDFESVLEPVKPLIIRQYRYQGLCCRAALDWNSSNVTMNTSEGLSRDRIDGSRADWVYVNGPGAGFMFMSDPSNYNSPQPLRIWDSKTYKGEHNVFVNYSPPKTGDWPMEAGKKYTLRYRIFVYDGEMTAQQADMLWKDYVNPASNDKKQVGKESVLK